MADNYKSSVDTVVDYVDQRSSRYSLNRPYNKIIEFEGSKCYTYPWSVEIPVLEGDSYISITANTTIDRLANNYYGDPKLWWVLAQVNDISNPLSEIEIGDLIRIPPLSRLIELGVTR